MLTSMCPYTRRPDTCCSRKRRAPSFRIPSSTVRSNLCAKGVYKGHIALRSSRAHACRGASTLSGRLAAEEPKQDTIGSANKLVGRHHSPGGIHTQCREISTSTHSAIDTHRCRISSRFRSVVSTDGPSSSVRRTDFRPIEPPSIDSLLLAVPPRTTELSNICDSLREVASQTTTTLHASSLGSCIEEPEGADSCKVRSVRPPSEMVARQKVYTGGHVAGHTRRPSEPVHGRFRVGVGSSPGRSPSEWTMVDEGDLAPHQSPGDAGRTERLVSLQGAVDQYDSTTHVRQRTRRLVPKETGRHGVCASLSPSAGSSSPGRDAQITLWAKHIPDERNALSDLLSRMNKVVHTEWTLHQSVVDSLFITWDKPHVDLFATRMNNRLPVFVSPMADPLALDVDAMSISWKGVYAYAFPPFVMLGRVLEKVPRDHPCEMILIAPKWPNQSWYAKLMELLVAFPLALPQREDLLTQPHNHRIHQSLQAVCLHACRLSSDPSKGEVFLRQLPSKSPEVDVSLPELSMTANGGSSLVGVLRNRSIHSRSLFLN